MNNNPPDLTADQWKAIAIALFKECRFAIEHLKSKGEGMIIISQDPWEARHWKDVMADAMEKMPGIKIDREAMMALDLPKKEFAKWKTERSRRDAEKAKG